MKELFSGATRVKNIGLFVESSFPEKKLYIADELRLTQILSNFVSNAVKFTDNGKIIISGSEISHQENHAMIEFSVTDTGLGISDKNQELLFQSFSQVNATSYSMSTGSGLGLSIVRSLVELMKGQYGVESAEGLGSKFWIRIPVEYLSGDQVEEEIKPEYSQSTELILKKLGLKVFIVEDNVTNQMVLSSMLKAMSPELSIELFNNGRQCYERYIKDPNVDLILMDIGMPVLNGDAATELIRKYEKENQIDSVTIVAVSAYVYKEDRNRFKAVGMNDFLSKPIEYGYLQNIIRKWLVSEEVVDQSNDLTNDTTPSLMVFNREDVMRNLGQNKKLAIEVIRSTVQEVPKFFERLYESIHEMHWIEARSTTHSLKGLIVQIGADIMAKEVIRLDDILHNGGEIAVDDVQNLEKLYAQLLDAIKADKVLSITL